jgi:hypothetical protein
LQAAEQAALQEGFTRFEMGSTLSGVPLYTLKGYEALEEIDVPVGEGRSISVVRMAKSAKQSANEAPAKSPSAEAESAR